MSKQQMERAEIELYDADFYQWTRTTAALIRAGRFSEIDREHLAEEIEDMGKRDYRELQSRLTILIAHLLKWQLQPEPRGKSWQTTIVEQRRRIRGVLRDSPSLKRIAARELSPAYQDAVELAATQTGLSPDKFPAACPYSLDEVMNGNFLPGAPPAP